MTTATIDVPAAPAKPRRARKTGDPRADRTAQPAAPAAGPTNAPTEPKPKPLTARARKRVVAEKLIAAAAELADSWDHAEITRDEACTLLGSWCNYIPGGIWDDRLGDRSGAGKRTTAKNQP